MNQYKPSERGQALVLIAFAIIGLIGMTALAIDGGNFFSDRRHAQNAADAAALATGLSWIRHPTNWDTAETDGMDRAASNGYDNDTITNTVEIHNPPVNGSYVDDPEYVQVIIVSHVQTYLAPVIGITQLTNRVDAVVRVELNPDSPILEGNAILALNEHDCPATTVSGTSNVKLIGGGVFVNSDCTNNTNKDAFTFNGGGGLIAPGLCTVGPNSVVNNGTTIQIGQILEGDDCPQVTKTTAFVEPNITCSEDAEVDDDDDTKLHPGNFTDNKFPPAGITFLYPGIYCITEGDFDFPNGTLTGSNVVIYVMEGEIRINGGAIELDAPDDGPYQGLLMAMPSSNNSAITINGNADMKFTGTILALSSHATINGTSDSEGMFSSQIITDTIDVSGGGQGFITYDGGEVWEPAFPPQVEFTE